MPEKEVGFFEYLALLGTGKVSVDGSPGAAASPVGSAATAVAEPEDEEEGLDFFAMLAKVADEGRKRKLEQMRALGYDPRGPLPAAPVPTMEAPPPQKISLPGAMARAVAEGAQQMVGGAGQALEDLGQRAADFVAPSEGISPVPSVIGAISAGLKGAGETLSAAYGASRRSPLVEEQNRELQQFQEQRPIAGYLVDVAQQAPQLAAMAALGPAALPGIGASAYGSAKIEATDQGATPEQATKMGLASGVIEMVTERFGTIPAVNRLVKAAMKDPAQEVSKSALRVLAKDVAKNGAEEVAADLLNRVAEIKIYKQDETITNQDLVSALYSGLVGMGVGGAVSAPTQGLQALDQGLQAAQRAIVDRQVEPKAQEEAEKMKAAVLAATQQAPEAVQGVANEGEVVLDEPTRQWIEEGERKISDEQARKTAILIEQARRAGTAGVTLVRDAIIRQSAKDLVASRQDRPRAVTEALRTEASPEAILAGRRTVELRPEPRVRPATPEETQAFAPEQRVEAPPQEATDALRKQEEATPEAQAPEVQATVAKQEAPAPDATLAPLKRTEPAEAGAVVPPARAKEGGNGHAVATQVDTIAGRLSLDEFEAKGYAPEQVTRQDWVNLMRANRRDLGQLEESGTRAAPFSDYEEFHRQAVQNAIKRGEEIDEEVLAGYEEGGERPLDRAPPKAKSVIPSGAFAVPAAQRQAVETVTGIPSRPTRPTALLPGTPAERQPGSRRPETPTRALAGRTPTMAEVEAREAYPTKTRLTRVRDAARLVEMLTGTMPRAVPERIQKIAERVGMDILGMTKGGKVSVAPDLAADPDFAAEVILHEIGHIADGLRGTTRGLVNKIQNLHTALTQTIRAADRADPKLAQKLREQAKRLSARWRKLSPVSLTNDSYKKYRADAREVYADVVGAILNDPELVQSEAPDVYREFFRTLSRNPRLDSAMTEILDELEASPDKIDEQDTEALVGESKRGLSARVRKVKEAWDPNPETVSRYTEANSSFWAKTANYFVDSKGALYRMRKDAMKAGNQKAALLLSKAVRMTEDAANRLAFERAYLYSWEGLVAKTLQEAGVKQEEFSLAMRLLDAARPDKFAARGIYGLDAARLYEKLQRELGETKAKAVQQALENWWFLRQQVLGRIAETNLFDPKVIGAMLNNPTYARRQALSVLEAERTVRVANNEQVAGFETGLASALSKREGSMQAMGDPVYETLLTDLALTGLWVRERAAKTTLEAVAAFDSGKGELVVKARGAGGGRYVAPPRGMVGVDVHENGKLVRYYVPDGIGKIYQRSNPVQLSRMNEGVVQIIGFLRKVLVTHNPGWALWNLQRDFWDLVKKTGVRNPAEAFLLAGAAAWDAGRELVRLYRDEAKSKKRDNWDLLNKVADWQRAKTLTEQQALHAGALLEFGDDRSALFSRYFEKAQLTEATHDQQFWTLYNATIQKSLQDGSFGPLAEQQETWQEKLASHLKKGGDVYDLVSAPGQFSERLVKAAGWKVLERQLAKLEAKEKSGAKLSKYEQERLTNLRDPSYRAMIVRNRAGTPNILRRGDGHALLNTMFLFSNASKEGLRSSWEAAREDPLGYTYKQLAFTVAPKLLMAFAALGFLDEPDEIEDPNGKSWYRWYQNIPDYVKNNAFVIFPVPFAAWTEDGKRSRYIMLPADFTSAVIGGALDLIAKKMEGRDVDLEDFAELASQLAAWGPQAFNPFYESIAQGALLATGMNPPDLFRKRTMFTQREWSTMSEGEKWQKFALETMLNNGLSTIWSPQGSYDKSLGDERDVDEKMQQIPGVGPIFKRMWRTTQAGQYERGKEISAAIAWRKEATVNRPVDEIIREALEENKDSDLAEAWARIQEEVPDYTGSYADVLKRSARIRSELYGRPQSDRAATDMGRTPKEKEEIAAELDRRAAEAAARAR